MRILVLTAAICFSSVVFAGDNVIIINRSFDQSIFLSFTPDFSDSVASVFLPECQFVTGIGYLTCVEQGSYTTDENSKLQIQFYTVRNSQPVTIRYELEAGACYELVYNGARYVDGVELYKGCK